MSQETKSHNLEYFPYRPKINSLYLPLVRTFSIKFGSNQTKPERLVSFEIFASEKIVKFPKIFKTKILCKIAILFAKFCVNQLHDF